MTDTADTLSRTRRRNAHADIDRASPEDLASVAHNLVDDLVDIIDAIARQAAAQTHSYIHHARPSTSPPPSQETEAELLQERQVVALERIAQAMTVAPRREALTTTQAGELLEVSNSRVQYLASKGRFTAVMVGKRWAIDRESLGKFIGARKAAEDAKEAALQAWRAKNVGV